MKLASIFTNKTFIIGAVVVALVIIIYLAGKKAGEKCSFFDKITGNCNDPEGETIFVSVGNGKWTPNKSTDNIYTSIHNDRWFDLNGEVINAAFATFNALNDEQRVAVVNDWNNRIKGRDFPGWFTGNYDTLKNTIEEYSDNFQPEVELAYNWMISNGIT